MSPSERVLELEEAGRRQGRDRQEERHPGGRDPVEAEQQAGRDRGAGARDARGPARRTARGPSTIASRMVSSRLAAVLTATRSANTITALQTISATATTHSDAERAGDDVLQRRSRRCRSGCEPTMTYQPIRWSRSPRSSGLTSPAAHADAIRQMSLRSRRGRRRSRPSG